MISTSIFDGNIGGEGPVAFEINAFQEETVKYSFTAQIRCLVPVPLGLNSKLPKLKIFHNAMPLMDEEGGSPGSDFGVEDVDELATCMHQEEIYLGPNKLNPEVKFIFKTGCFPSDGVQCISWLEAVGLPANSYHLVLWLNEITFSAVV